MEFVILGKKCNSTDLVSQLCAENETCMNKTELCECLPNYKRIADRCMMETASSESSAALIHENTSGHIVAGVLIPIFVILVVICGIYVTKRYQVIMWIRTKLNKRSINYDEVMIGQDDDDDDDLPLQD